MKVLALAAALMLAACSCSVPTATSSPSTASAEASTSTATETMPADSTTPTPVADLPSWPPQSSRDFQFVPINQLTLSKGGRYLSLDFVGARAYSSNDPCSADYEATVTVVDDVLEIGVEESRRPTPTEGTACDAMGYARSLRVDLNEPFTGSVWRDLNGYLHFLAPPDGLVELAGLPDGWELRAQRDVEESLTGRWERTYSPDPLLVDATQSVVLYQSFEGPVNVTGGTEERQVVVNGRPAILYRWPPNGELVLIWRLGNDGLALVAYEKRFSVDELIALAESATPAAPSIGQDTVPLAVSGAGSFDCGSGFHGCTAWLAIRPVDWRAPVQWAPGRADRDFRPSPSAIDMSIWLVSGPGVGGPGALPPGDYRFMAVVTEADDTKPWVLGTDEQPGTGVLNLTIACEQPVTVPDDARAMVVRVTFGPQCSIEAAPADP